MWVYPCLLLAASCGLAAAQRDPQDDVDDLALVVRDSAPKGFYRAGGANVGVFPGQGWTLTVYVGDTRRYGPGSFLVLTKLEGRLAGELLTMPTSAGALTAVSLDGASLDLYLRRSGLDLSGLDAAVGALPTSRPAPPVAPPIAGR